MSRTNRSIILSLGLHFGLAGAAWLLTRQQSDNPAVVHSFSIETPPAPPATKTAESKPTPPQPVEHEPAMHAKTIALAPAPKNESAERATATQNYFLSVRDRVYSEIRYPREFSARRIQGHVRLELVIDPSGNARSMRVSTGSGFAQLDTLALEAARRAAPFNSFPARFGTVTLVLPVDFVAK